VKYARFISNFADDSKMPEYAERSVSEPSIAFVANASSIIFRFLGIFISVSASIIFQTTEYIQ